MANVQCEMTDVHVTALEEFFVAGKNYISPGAAKSCSKYTNGQNGRNCLLVCGIIEKAAKPTPFFDKYFIFTVYGVGGSGIVVGMAEIDNPDKRIAAKFLRIYNHDESAFRYEMHMQRQFAALGIAPAVIDSVVLLANNPALLYGVIVMERIDVSIRALMESIDENVRLGLADKETMEGAKRDIVKNDILELLELMSEKGLTHGDMHLDNVVVLSNGQTGLIDFGRSHDLCHNFFLDRCVLLAMNGFRHSDHEFVEAFRVITDQITDKLEDYDNRFGRMCNYHEMWRLALGLIDSNLLVAQGMARKFHRGNPPLATTPPSAKKANGVRRALDLLRPWRRPTVIAG